MNLPRPTALGIKAALFYLLLLGAYFAARYSNLFFLLMAFLAVLGAYGLVATWHNMKRVAGAVLPVAPVPAGAGTPLRVRLDAGGGTRFAVTVEVDLDVHGRVEATAPHVKGETQVLATVPPLPRGLYALRRARAGSTWPFGIFRARVSLDAPERLVVFPDPLEGEGKGGAGEGEDLAAVPVDGMIQPAGVREFRQGDDPRRIHWKASARKRGFVVLEWEGGTGTGPEVVLDRRADGARFEHALRLLTGIALQAKDCKEPLKLHTQGLEETYGPGHRPWDELLEFLAATEALPPDAPAPPRAGHHAVRLPPDPPFHAGGRP